MRKLTRRRPRFVPPRYSWPSGLVTCFARWLSRKGFRPGGIDGIPGMPQNFIGCDREQVFLMPPSLREWLAEDHLAWFVIDAVAGSIWGRSMRPIARTGMAARRMSRR